MGTTEDFRKVVQDLITPDLKVIAVPLDALEKAVSHRFTLSEDLAKSRHETVIANIAARHAATMGALEMEKRLSKLEGLQIEKRA
jgi:hypothetical protein